MNYPKQLSGTQIIPYINSLNNNPVGNVDCECIATLQDVRVEELSDPCAHGKSEEKCRNYSQMSPHTVPPLVVQDMGSWYQVWDGGHRLVVAREQGRKTLPCYVIPVGSE